MTLTIKLPEDVAAYLAPLSDEERERYAVEALREALAERDAISNPVTFPLTTEDLADIAAGLADADSGRVVDGETVLREMSEHLAQLKDARRQAKAA